MTMKTAAKKSTVAAKPVAAAKPAAAAKLHRLQYVDVAKPAASIVAPVAAPKPTPTAGEARLAKMAVVVKQREQVLAALSGAAKSALTAAAKKPVAPIVPTAKPVAAAAKPTVKSTRGAPSGKITLLVKENPKRGESAKRFAQYKTGMTTEQALEKGLTIADLKWDVAHEFIAIK